MRPPQPLSRLLFRPSFRFSTSTRLSSTLGSSSLLTVRNIPATHIGHIRILSLNNPQSRNAISLQLLSELRTEIESVKEQVDNEATKGEVVGEGTRVLILASEVDEAFCAGADLKERKEMSKEKTNAFLTILRSTLQCISDLPMPTISAVSSVALGGGLELALSTDLRVFSSSATIGLPETRIGIIPGAGGTYRLQKLIGKAQALNLILSGRTINGLEARKLGICQNSLGEVDVGKGKEALKDVRERVLEKAVEMAAQICKSAPGAVQAALRAVREGTEEAENREYERCVGMEDRDEALRAFGEKRGPIFRGR